MAHKKLVIVGAGGHGKVVADIADKMNIYDEIYYLDDCLIGKEIGGKMVISGVEYAIEHKDDVDAFIAIGNASIRQNIFNRYRGVGVTIPTLIHPNAVIASDVKIGTGTVVMAGTVINSGTEIGQGVIINTCASVDHDNVIGDFVHISVGAHLAGNVSVDHSTWIGIGAVVSNNISIIGNVVIGAGATVVNDIEEEGTYVGVPARRL